MAALSSALFAVGGQRVSPNSILVAAAVLVALAYLVRLALLPRPIPGIPYNKVAANRILGDIPDFKDSVSKRKWFSDQVLNHKSPVAQVFIGPTKRPWVIIGDYRESQDLLVRRHLKEIDKDRRAYDLFSGIMPTHHITMMSDDPRFKGHKELVRDLMLPAFLNEVSAPRIYSSVTDLVRFWKLKEAAAGGHPFQAEKDIFSAALDIIMAVAFGLPPEDGNISQAIPRLEATQTHYDGPAEAPYPFEPVVLNDDSQACIDLVNSISVPINSIMPRLAHWRYLRKPHMRRALALKNGLMRKSIEAGVQRMRDGAGTASANRCAVDQILAREVAIATKRGVEPDYFSQSIQDEIFGYIVGGYDTTATTLAWGVKYMALNPESQSRLRTALHAAFPAAAAAGAFPSIEALTSTSVPYLDAFIEETLRHSPTVAVFMRRTTADTVVLGNVVPRGITLVFAAQGPGMLHAPVPAPASAARRPATPPTAKARVGEWDAATIGDFVPERWLRAEKAGGPEVFDAAAGPTMPFAAGPRGCFGRRLAYLELRVTVAALVWNFVFEPAGGELDSMGTVDRMTTLPQQCYVKIRSVKY